MLYLMISKAKQGTEISISSDDQETAKRVYRNFLKASLKLDKCTKTLHSGRTASGGYQYMIAVPKLPYVVACDRVMKLWPDAEVKGTPHALIGG